MKTLRLSNLLYGLLAAAFVLSLAITAPSLPPRVASHFDAAGRANGWMNRSSYIPFMLLFGLGLPAGMSAVFLLIRFLPDGMINLPNKDHCLAPEERSRTHDYLRRHSSWLGCLSLVLMTGLHLLTVQANRQTNPRLSNPALLALTVFFAAGVLLWSLALILRFRRPGPPA